MSNKGRASSCPSRLQRHMEPGTAGLPFRKVDRPARQGTNHRGHPAPKRAGGALFHQEAPPEWMRRGGRKGATVPRLDARPQASPVAGCRASKACQGSSQECQGQTGPDGGAGLTGTAKDAQEATDWPLPGPWIPGVGRPTRLFSAGRLLGSSGRLAGSGWPAWDRSWGDAFALSRVLDFHGSTQILAVGCWKRHANLPPLNA